MAVTAQTESNNTENVFWVLGRVPMFTFDMNIKSFIFAHFGVIALLYLIVCMYISYKTHNRFTKETLLIVSDVDVYMLPALRSITSCTTDMNLKSCILNHQKMRQSQIATIQESLSSHFVIMAVTALTESNNTENVFWVLGRVPMFTFDMNMKSFIFAHFGVISLLYLIVCMYISYNAHNRFTKETLLIVSDVDVYMFPALRSIPSCTTDMNLRSCILKRHKMRQSQIATIQESLPSHFCDLSHFVIMAVTAQTESNNTENGFWVLGRVPMFIFDMNMKSFIIAHFGVISMLYLIVCMYISYEAHNRFAKETLLIVSDVDVCMFPALRSIPSCTTDMSLRSCILNRHKMRQSQIATIQESLPSHFVICRILWPWPWRHKLSPITLKRVLGTWESTHVHFWHEYEKFHFCPFWRYFTVISDCVYVYQL